MFETGTDDLLVELSDHVATLTLNRPAARNALSPDLTAALVRALHWCADAEEVRAVLVTGAGTAFCAGADVKAMGARQASKPPSAEARYREMRTRHQGIGGGLYRLRKPTIAALPGAAAGAGMAIALACDLRIAARDAFLTTAYARIGLSGDYGIAWLLSRVVGPARARELLLLSPRVSAEAALEIGLVNKVVDGERLADEAIALARQLAAGPPVVYAYMKDNLDEAFLVDYATAVDHEADRVLKTSSTADHREAVAAFAEKRQPRFEGQ